MKKEELIGILDEIINIFNDINRVFSLGKVYSEMIKESNENISYNNKYLKEYENFKPELTKQQQAILNNNIYVSNTVGIFVCILIMIVIPASVGSISVSKFGGGFDTFMYGFCFGFFVLSFIFTYIFSITLKKIAKSKQKEVNKLINLKICEYQNSNKERYTESKKEIAKSLASINNISQKVLDVQEYLKNQQEKLYKYEYVIPKKYLTNKAILEFREYIYYDRASTVGECINIYEQIRMHEEKLDFMKEELNMKQMMYEEELYQQQLRHEEELKRQNEMNKNMNDIAKSNEIIINQNKEKMKLDKKKYEEERYERLNRERKELRRELGHKD